VLRYLAAHCRAFSYSAPRGITPFRELSHADGAGQWDQSYVFASAAGPAVVLLHASVHGHMCAASAVSQRSHRNRARSAGMGLSAIRTRLHRRPGRRYRRL